MRLVALGFIVMTLLYLPHMIRSTFDTDWAWEQIVRANLYKLWGKMPPVRTKTWERLNFLRGCAILGSWILMATHMLNLLINGA